VASWNAERAGSSAARARRGYLKYHRQDWRQVVTTVATHASSFRTSTMGDDDHDDVSNGTLTTAFTIVSGASVL
jgi:hypothetical protein